MALLLKTLIKGYHYLNEDTSDPRTQDWFLIGSPWGIFALVGFYLYFVQVLGPRLMERRKPYKIERIMQIYDVMQILLNAYVLRLALVLGWLREYSFKCEPVDYSNTPRGIEVASGVWFFFMVKVTDLVDTFFFVLRKKQNQVSFLHVYHHAGMVLGCWVAVKWLPGGHITFLGLVNSFVHVVMYTYYLLASLKISEPWWKKHITQIQLVQFFLILYHFSQLLWQENCGFPKWPAAVFIPQNLFMIVLFGDFYYKTYVKKAKSVVKQNGLHTVSHNKKEG